MSASVSRVGRRHQVYSTATQRTFDILGPRSNIPEIVVLLKLKPFLRFSLAPSRSSSRFILRKALRSVICMNTGVSVDCVVKHAEYSLKLAIEIEVVNGVSRALVLHMVTKASSRVTTEFRFPSLKLARTRQCARSITQRPAQANVLK
jgi:hypothetical protein